MKAHGDKGDSEMLKQGFRACVWPYFPYGPLGPNVEAVCQSPEEDVSSCSLEGPRMEAQVDSAIDFPIHREIPSFFYFLLSGQSSYTYTTLSFLHPSCVPCILLTPILPMDMNATFMPISMVW